MQIQQKGYLSLEPKGFSCSSLFCCLVNLFLYSPVEDEKYKEGQICLVVGQSWKSKHLGLVIKKDAQLGRLFAFFVEGWRKTLTISFGGVTVLGQFGVVFFETFSLQLARHKGCGGMLKQFLLHLSLLEQGGFCGKCSSMYMLVL